MIGILLLRQQGCIDVQDAGEPLWPRHVPEGPDIQRLQPSKLESRLPKSRVSSGSARATRTACLGAEARLGQAPHPAVTARGARILHVREGGNVKMATFEETTDRMKAAVGSDSGLDKTLKFNLKGDGFIFIDRTSVSNEDKPADLTITISLPDLEAMGAGKLDAMTAVMTGKMQLSDMGVAMAQQSKLQALFAKMA
jgi:putative sterol carrier protein